VKGPVWTICLLLVWSGVSRAGERKAGLVFAQPGPRALKLDLLYPDGPAPPGGYPVVVNFHGGGWMIGGRYKDFWPGRIKNRRYAVATVDYRLSGTAKFPAQIEDARAAAEWLRRHARALRLNPWRMALAGTSAGGHLALLLALESAGSFKGVAALYPPTDLVAIVPPWKRDRRDNPVARLLGGPVNERLDAARLGSPVAHVSSQSPPVLLVHGGRDRMVPVEQSRLLGRALVKNGAEATLVILPARGHGFVPPPPVLRRIDAFFNRVLGID